MLTRFSLVPLPNYLIIGRSLLKKKEAGCEKWFLDKTTGSKAERKGLDEALAYLQPGDTLVVWKVDRAGRSLTHLIDLLRGLKERSEAMLCQSASRTGLTFSWDAR